jgi:flagellar biosynthesis/type III secretory pathway chaperone
MESQKDTTQLDLSAIREMAQLLQRLLGHHRQLWDQVRAERDALINADRNLIQEVALTKKALVESIRDLEGQRLNRMAVLAQLWKRAASDLPLSEIIVLIQTRDPQLSQSLRTSQNALRHLIERIQALNESNRQLVENSMKHVDAMKRNLMGEVEPRSALYTPTGNKTAPSAATGQSRFISKEA